MELIDPHGALRVAEVNTGAAGVYTAYFDLHYQPSLESDRKKWKRAKTPVHGVYRVQALIFGADHAADAESNLLFVTR